MIDFVSDRVENIVGEGENAGYHNMFYVLQNLKLFGKGSTFYIRLFNLFLNDKF